MKRSASIVLCALLIAGCAEAPVAGPSDPARALLANSGASVVSGSGHITLSDEWRSFSFHANVRPNGEVDGSFQAQAREIDPDIRVSGDVVCLSIVGNEVWVAAIITRSTFQFAPVGSYTFWHARDNGEGANEPADEISLASGGAPEDVALNYCVVKPAVPPMFPVEGGNIQIR